MREKKEDKKLHAGMLETADNSIKGKGDGRISGADAKKIMKHLKMTSPELGNATLEHIKNTYNLTSTAETLFGTVLMDEKEKATLLKLGKTITLVAAGLQPLIPAPIAVGLVTLF